MNAVSASQPGSGGTLTQRDFRRIASVMLAETGIELPETKMALVQSRLNRRLKALSFKDFDVYCDFVENRANAQERMEMFSVLTTNVTGFFRETHHFSFVRDQFIPSVRDKLRRGRPVRIWSAGCSSGEEPYSLAITLHRAIPEIRDCDIKILATDIDLGVLKRAISGIYSDQDVEDLDADARKFMEPVDGGARRVKVADPIRNMVFFRHLNLMNEWPFQRRFDLIMCRNVVIYFQDDVKSRIWARFVERLEPTGFLVTGHSERLAGEAARRMELVATTTYAIKKH